MKRITATLTGIFALCQMVLAAGDAWVNTNQDAEYPATLYFVGVGLSEKSAESAKQNAAVEVKKQISVTIKASAFESQSSDSKNGKEINTTSSAESRAKLTTSGDVQGIEVVKTTQKGGIFYAMAVLDKQKFASNAKTLIKEAKENLAKNIEGAKADIASGAIGSAVKKLAAAKGDIQKILEQRTLLTAAAELTEAEKLTITEADISALYEKCVAGIKMVKTSGDNQAFAVGMVPSDPFIVTVTASGSPVPTVLVKLYNSKNKPVMEKYTDASGVAEFFLGDNAEIEVGSHSYMTAISISVGSDLKKILASQNQTFLYTVKSNPCFAKFTMDVASDLTSSADDITKAVKKNLSGYDIKEDPQAAATLKATISAKETGTVKGLSESSTFVSTEVTATFTLIDDDGKNIASVTATAKGLGGSVPKSVVKGIDNLKLKKDIAPLLEKLCGASAAPTTPKKKIAVFSFKNMSVYNGWWEVSANISDMIVTKLINSRKFDVIERDQLQKIMEEKSLAMSGVVEQNEAQQAALLAGADLIMIGSAHIIGDKIEVDARIIDAKSGIAKCAMSSTGFSLEDLRALADDLVGKISSSAIK